MENKALEPQTSSQQGTGVYTSESLQVSISWEGKGSKNSLDCFEVWGRRTNHLGLD